ncbi:hypothetical protein D3C80_2001150 [compost metagenome]
MGPVPSSPVLGGRAPGNPVEDPVELGEAGEAAGAGNIRDFHLGIEQKLLGVADTGHLNIVNQRKARHLLELVGEIIRADKELFG